MARNRTHGAKCLSDGTVRSWSSRKGRGSFRRSSSRMRLSLRPGPNVPIRSDSSAKSPEGLPVQKPNRICPAHASVGASRRWRVAPPLRRVKGAHETSHKSTLRFDWWRSSWTPLDSSPLRRGFAGSKADDDARRRLSALPARARDSKGRVPGTEERQCRSS